MYTTEQDRIDAVRSLINNGMLDEWDIDALMSVRTLINDAEARGWAPVGMDDDEAEGDDDFDPER